MDLSKLPSTFYRVSLKAFIFDSQDRLLLGKTEDGKWDPPGGGWEHDGTIEECLSRELKEELGINSASFGEIIVIYRGRNRRGFETIKIAVRTTVEDNNFRFGELISAEYKSKEELPGLDFSTDEGGIKKVVDKIWPE
jgi:ADP-ribose pyrophosphatase YjhB (NUDIX family)